MDTIIELSGSTGFTNLLMFMILILLYRVVSIMEWSKVTLNEIAPKIKLMAEITEIEYKWKGRDREPRSDKELGE
jgi:hypothetical protein